MGAQTDTTRSGSTGAFDTSWKSRRETRYNHWTPGRPSNQIQLAFRCHWEVFREIIGDRKPGLSLEVGCGRGSISSYFADHGWDTILLDCSESVLHVARDIFAQNSHVAAYIRGDANELPLSDETADVVVSIGLLEHFEDPSRVLMEQARVLAPGGVMLVYVVPEYDRNIQRRFARVNRLLALGRRLGGNKGEVETKEPLFRSDEAPSRYLGVLERLRLQDLRADGVYPLPMISHSPEFPFSLLPRPLEYVVTRVFEAVLVVRHLAFRRNPWLCREGFGQAFLVVARKSQRK